MAQTNAKSTGTALLAPTGVTLCSLQHAQQAGLAGPVVRRRFRRGTGGRRGPRRRPRWPSFAGAGEGTAKGQEFGSDQMLRNGRAVDATTAASRRGPLVQERAQTPLPTPGFAPAPAPPVLPTTRRGACRRRHASGRRPWQRVRQGGVPAAGRPGGRSSCTQIQQRPTVGYCWGGGGG